MKKLFFISLFLIFIYGTVYAHPHMAIYSSCDFTFKNNDLNGVWIDFRFDQYFSLDLISNYDRDKNSIFDDSETQAVYNQAFINLKKYGFFIGIRDDSGRTAPDNVEHFSVSVKEEMIVYRFYIKLTGREKGELYLSVYDPTFFCACYYEESAPVSFSGENRIQTEYSIVENTDYPVFYDPCAAASDNLTYDEWQPGLQTFYPQEIHIVY